MWPAIIGAVAGGQGYISPSKNLQSVFEGYTFDRWAKADENWENQKVADKYMDKQNQWNERMANSAHQREVQDLVNAGLNPILSSGGKGADSPTSASPTNMGMKGMSPALHFPAVHADIGQLLQTQQTVDNQTAKTFAEIEKIKAETKAIPSKVALAEAQAKLVNKNEALSDFTVKGALRTGSEWLQKAAKAASERRTKDENLKHDTWWNPQPSGSPWKGK